ncbi:MAG: hypothetical protein ACREIS_01330 [Nitrospiraceae bacterium]
MMHWLSAFRGVAVLGLAIIFSTTLGLPSASAEAQVAAETLQPVASHEMASPQDMPLESQCKNDPLLVAEGSNSCAIVSCGMGLKDTCKITCPKDKTPKCSCDCVKNVGPLCTEYKANCKCQ